MCVLMSKLHWWAFQPTHGRQPAAAQLKEPLSRRTSEGRLREWQTAVEHRHGQQADCSSAQARAEKADYVTGNSIVPWFFEDGPKAMWMAPSFFSFVCIGHLAGSSTQYKKKLRSAKEVLMHVECVCYT